MTRSRRSSPPPGHAYIEPNFMGRDRHLVVFHPVLNYPQTPVEVLRIICKHELTHLACPPCMYDGWHETHPPEFWDTEETIGPERYAVWHWEGDRVHLAAPENIVAASDITPWLLKAWAQLHPETEDTLAKT